ncbi:acetate uptake transporter family protein Ecym_2741 [Eremothecium cymbalariae DBVPG|uniref:Uncharacterized protein n=1 Tax=Eremothecium cymbalariae (strain CBS 270.75 / DBVPG 7215 / KCTC 17166 / NRRL Y-17582) TaxID=931890 RepID=G8JPH4_ERECY|nr:Hypothetical protein Ecym_2741 [Eremothecium cymbalariae DBVPG\
MSIFDDAAAVRRGQEEGNGDLENQRQQRSRALPPTTAASTITPNAYSTGLLNDYDDDQAKVEKVRTSGAHDEYIYLGQQKFLKSDLYEAFGAPLNAGLAPVATRQFANPSPLGLSAFALTTFVLSLYNCNAAGVELPGVVVGLAFFYGGLIQLLAGMWEMVVGNTFGAVALSSYGGFWLSYAAINLPWFGIISSYIPTSGGSDVADYDQFRNALGIYLLAWAIFTFMLTICTMKSSLSFFALFLLLGVTFVLLAASEFKWSAGLRHAGGVVGVIVAIIAWYNALAGLATKENSYVRFSTVSLPGVGKSWSWR